MEARILLYENRGDEDPSLGPLLEALGARVAACRDRTGLLEQLMSFAPRVVVYAMRTGAPADHSMLEMLRRMAPGVPIAIVTAGEPSETRRLERDFRPLWIGERERVDGLAGALRSALSLPEAPGAP